MQVSRGYLLPIDLIVTLIEELPGRRQEKYYGNHRLVSKGWRNACQLAMIKHLNQKHYFPFKNNAVWLTVRRLGQHLRHLHLRKIMDEQFEMLIDNCPALTSFRTKNMTAYQVNYLSVMAPKLTTLKCKKMHYIQGDLIHFPPLLQKVSLGKIFPILFSCLVKQCAELNNLELHKPWPKMLTQLPSTLTKLRCLKTDHEHFNWNLPNLKTLTVSVRDVLDNLQLIPLTPSITKLTIECYSLKHLTLPAHIKTFKLRLDRYDDARVRFPEQTIRLKIDDVTEAVERLPPLPAKLNKLTIHSESLDRLPRLPQSLQTLKLDIPVTNIPKLPKGLKNLYIGLEVKAKRIVKLPSSLRTLCCSNYEATILKLPNKLEVLGLTGWSHYELPKFPDSLLGLSLIYTRGQCHLNLSSLTGLRDLELGSMHSMFITICLPTSLKTLSLNACSWFKETPELPACLTHLYVKDCYRLESLNLPKSLKRLKLKHTPNVSYRSLSRIPKDTEFKTDLQATQLLYETGILQGVGRLLGGKRKAS